MMVKIIAWLVVVFGVLLLVAIIVCAVIDGREWDNYRQQHGCQLTGEKKEDWFFMSISNGAGGTTMMPVDDTKYQWKCDNGIIWH